MSEEGLLSRWSRRKLQDPQQNELEEQLLEQPVEPELPAQSPASEEQEPPLLTDADMPDIETLDEDSDFSGFMSPGVSDELRNLALRKLFRASVFNVRDGLDEYDEDYTTFEKLGDIVTCDMKHQMEMEARKKLEQQESEQQQVPDDSAEPLDAIEEDSSEDSESSRHSFEPSADQPATDRGEPHEPNQLESA